MERHPLIGIPTQSLGSTEGIPDDVPEGWMMHSGYFDAVARAGGAPAMIPLIRDVEALESLWERLDGLLLAGGVDVEPERYGADRHAQCGPTDPDRDRVELLMTRWAMEAGMPIFGICRGMQVLNVAAGGTLIQDCATMRPDSIEHNYALQDGYDRAHLAHEVTVDPSSLLAEALGDRTAHVNSTHHQALERLGDRLRVVATAPDGMIEAVEREGEAFTIGVQWHPEAFAETDLETRRLFERFVEAAREFGRARLLASSAASS